MELDDIMKNIGPDVVHWHNTKGFIGQPYAAKHAATIYTAHDYYLICPRSNLLRPDLSTCHGPYNCLSCHLRWMKPLPLWRSGSRRVVRLDRRIAVVSPSEFLARRLCQDGITVTRVIRNFTPDLSRRSATGNADENLILYAGMLEPHKGLNTLIRGFAMSASTHGFRLVITGEGSMKEHLSRLITDLGVSDRVDLLGFVSRHDLNALRSRARFQAIPSEWPENSPLTAIEALSHEVPLIVSDQGGLPEIANPGGGSLTFKGGNPASLSATLADAWISLGRVEDMRRKARCRYEELFTAKRHLADYLDLVRNLQCGG
jgi:glycosyltransferase involved in cell wall biosynthesis